MVTTKKYYVYISISYFNIFKGRLIWWLIKSTNIVDEKGNLRQLGCKMRYWAQPIGIQQKYVHIGSIFIICIFVLPVDVFVPAFRVEIPR